MLAVRRTADLLFKSDLTLDSRTILTFDRSL